MPNTHITPCAEHYSKFYICTLFNLYFFNSEKLLGTFHTRSSRCVGTLKLRTFEEGSWESLMYNITQRSDVIRFKKN